jgi:hypothetical protein
MSIENRASNEQMVVSMVTNSCTLVSLQKYKNTIISYNRIIFGSKMHRFRQIKNCWPSISRSAQRSNQLPSNSESKLINLSKNQNKPIFGTLPAFRASKRRLFCRRRLHPNIEFHIYFLA